MDLSKEQISKIMRLIIWDYNIDPYELYEVVTGIKETVFHFDFERVFLRMLEWLSWYDLITLLGIDFLRKNLTNEIIDKIRIQELRDKYEYARKVLQGEPVSPSGWSIEYRERIQHTLLSNRWYRTKQILSQP
jgi:hypothetical protein